MDILKEYLNSSTNHLLNLSYKSTVYDFEKVSSNALTGLIVDLNSYSNRNYSSEEFKIILNSYIVKGKINKVADKVIIKNNLKTIYNIEMLRNYSHNCDYDGENRIKDYKRVNKSALITIEAAIAEVSREIKNNFKTKIPQININRTDKDYIIKYTNYIYNVIYNSEKTSCAQFAFNLWAISCIYRKFNGDTIASYWTYGVGLYNKLISLFFELYNKDKKSEIISENILQLSYALIKRSLYEYYIHILDLIFYNKEDQLYINQISNNIIGHNLSVQTGLKAIIIEFDFFYKIYFFKQESKEKIDAEFKYKLITKNGFGGFGLCNDDKKKASEVLVKRLTK